jgi:ribosome-associated protein
MHQRTITADLLGSEVEFSSSRSSGPGGQNVNKVNTKVNLRFDIPRSAVLTGEEKALLLQKLSNKLTTDGVLILSSQDKRSQLQNKENAIAKFNALIAKAFEKKKKRKATKPSKSAVQSRIKKKKEHSEKKGWRRRVGD